MDQLARFEELATVLGRGDTKMSIRLGRGLQIDLRVVPPKSFGAALQYFTGSKNHNVRLRERAQKKKLRLNEYGLFPDDGVEAPPQTRGIKSITARTEQEIYKALGLPYIPPELREDRGEFGGEIPTLKRPAEDRVEVRPRANPPGRAQGSAPASAGRRTLTAA